MVALDFLMLKTVFSPYFVSAAEASISIRAKMQWIQFTEASIAEPLVKAEENERL